MRIPIATQLILVFFVIGCGEDVPPGTGPESGGSSLGKPASPDQPSDQASSAETKTNEVRAKETVTQLLTATKSNDLDALMELTDVPFLLGGTVFNSAEELRPQHVQGAAIRD